MSSTLTSTTKPSELINLKLLLMGDSGTGKSSILQRFCDDQFLGEGVQPATIGIDFKIKFMDLEDKTISGNVQKLKLTIWDTAGQERFRSLTSSYYRGAQGVILVYDVSNRDSFDNLKSMWLKELNVYADLDELVLMVVGNKVDLLEDRQVSSEEGRQLAQDLSALFMESSAKTRIGIKSIFEELVRKILNSSNLKSLNREKKVVSLLPEEDEDSEQTSSLCSC